MSIEVQLVYTFDDLPPEVYATYDESTSEQCRDPHLRQMVIETLCDAQPRSEGVWSTRVIHRG